MSVSDAGANECSFGSFWMRPPRPWPHPASAVARKFRRNSVLHHPNECSFGSFWMPPPPRHPATASPKNGTAYPFELYEPERTWPQQPAEMYSLPAAILSRGLTGNLHRKQDHRHHEQLHRLYAVAPAKHQRGALVVLALSLLSENGPHHCFTSAAVCASISSSIDFDTRSTEVG